MNDLILFIGLLCIFFIAGYLIGMNSVSKFIKKFDKEKEIKPVPNHRHKLNFPPPAWCKTVLKCEDKMCYICLNKCEFDNRKYDAKP
jgi:hypothetical protein